MKRFVCRCLLVWSWLHMVDSSANAQVNVLTYHNNLQRTGENLNEAVLTPANVNSTTFGKLFSYAVDGHVYAQPLYVSNLWIPGYGVRNVIFIATQHNSVYAFDADANTGSADGLLWHINLGPSAATPDPNFGYRYGSYDAIRPEIGITGTPVIDLATGTLYLDAFTHEGADYIHRLHALNIATGAEQPFSPVVVTASISGSGVGGENGIVSFDAKQQVQRAALTLAGGVLYVAFGSYDDTNPYHGWIVGFDPATLAQLPNQVFNSTPNATIAEFGPDAGEGGIWMAGGGLAVDANLNLYFGTGNGSFNAFNGTAGTEFGDSILKVSTSGGLSVADYFTPYNQDYLAANDLDLGSAGVTLLPDQPGPHPHLLVTSGKSGLIYLIDRDQFTEGNNHYDPTGDHVLQKVALAGGAFDTPAFFNGTIFYCATHDSLRAFPLINGLLSLVSTSGPRTFGFPGATPSISANGTSAGIVWVVQRSNPAVLAAYDAANVSTEIYNSEQAAAGRDQLAPGVKFAVPTIANGKVYVGGENSVSVFGLLDPYLNWRTVHFGGAANDPEIAGDFANPDGDAAPNLLEYALTSDPNLIDADHEPTGLIAGGRFELQFNRNLAASDLTYLVQATDALDEAWSDAATYTSANGWIANQPGIEVSESTPRATFPDRYVQVTVRDANSFGDASSRRFFRLLVHR